MAARLRKEGDRDASDRVKGLRKPSLVAWTVNQLAHKRELDVQRLIRAGERLQQAQTGAVLGADGDDDFAAARDDERDALRRLAAAAREVLKEGGHAASETTVNKIGSTLRASAASAEGRDQLGSGRLTDEVEPRGFEAFMGLDVTPRPARAVSAKAKRGGGRRREAPPEPRVDRRLEKARSALLEARSDARDRTQELSRAEKAAAAARSELQRAEAEVDRLRKRAEQARGRVERLEAKIRDLAR